MPIAQVHGKMTAQEVNEPRTREDIDESLFRQLESYPWHSDAEFQNGLESILGPDASPDQAEQLTLRARCFYFSRYASEYSNNAPSSTHASEPERTISQ